MLAVMLAATWILAIATTALAIEGGTAVWKYVHLRPGRNRRDIEAMQREITLLHHAAWMDVSRENQGTTSEGDDKIRDMLMLDGWRPDMDLAGQAGSWDLSRIQATCPACERATSRQRRSRGRALSRPVPPPSACRLPAGRSCE